MVMNTIPASQLVQVVPGVLSGGGTAQEMIGLLLTQNTRVPSGQVLSFPTATAVGAYFGLSSAEYNFASTYFAGFLNCTQTPAALLFWQYNITPVDAYLRGGTISGLTLAQLQAITGTLTVVIDGYTWTTSSINLSTATSFTSAASSIQSSLTASPPSAASVTASIANVTDSLTASIGGTGIATNIMTVTAAPSFLPVGAILSGTSVSTGTRVLQQLTGTTGGVGTYVVSISQAVASETITATYGTLTVTGVTSGAIAVGNILSGTNVTTGTQVSQLGTGTGGDGTYYVTPGQTVTGESITAVGGSPTVTYDSVLGAFVIASSIGINAGAGSINYATGTTSASLLLTAATGAVLSPANSVGTPATNMTTVTNFTNNFASFTYLQDPDQGNGNANKLAFALWNSQQGNEYWFVGWDTDPTPTESQAATSSFGYVSTVTNQYSGTSPIYSPTQGPNIAAFAMGWAASLNFTSTNGRATLAFRQQSGISPDVTNVTIADNLAGSPQTGNFANGYNFYGAWGTNTTEFNGMQRGTVSGPFLWADSYVNQIWLNNSLQESIMEGLVNTLSVPYNAQGSALIEAFCQDPIQAAVNFGAIRAGVTLSAEEAAEVNNAAGGQISGILSTRGWYLQIGTASALTRGQRTSPPCTLWYTDGQSVQAINLASIEII